MKLAGKLRSVFTVEGRGDVITTDRVVGIFPPSAFPPGTVLEVRNSQGLTKQLHIRSGEAVFDGTKDFLAFILQETIDKKEIEAFTEVWCETGLEQLNPCD